MFSRSAFFKLGTITTAIAAGLFFTSVAFAAPSATAGPGSLSVQATGTDATDSGGCTTPAIVCPSGHTCLCATGTYSTSGNNGFNRGTASLALRIDLSDLGQSIHAVPACAPAAGAGTISNKKGNITITFFASGTVCETTNSAVRPTNGDVFTGSYVINGGTGKYSSATGAGTIGASGSFLTVTDVNPVPSQASFNGSVQR